MIIMDPGFVSSVIGYGLTKSLDEVWKRLQVILLFPDLIAALKSRLVRIRPMVEAIAQHASPGTALYQPGVQKWVDDLKTLVDDSKKLLDKGSVFKEGRFREPFKKNKFAAYLAKLMERFDALTKVGVLVTLMKTDGLARKLSAAAETADLLEKFFQKLQTTAGEQAIVTRTNQDSTMKALRALERRVDDFGYMQHQYLFKGLSIQFDTQGSTSNAPVNRPVDHPLASTLKELYERTGRDKRCTVKLEISDPTDDPPHGFRPPRELVPRKPAQASLSDRRGRAVEGGFEVHNDTKVEFTIEVLFSDDWFFYILQVDHAAKGSTPNIFFPVRVGVEEDFNLISQRIKERVFPRHTEYRDDPFFLKLERSDNVAADSYDRMYLYVFVVNTCLTPGRKPPDAITIEDVENTLNQMPPEELNSRNVIVEHFLLT